MAKKHARRGKKHRPMDHAGFASSSAIASLGPAKVVPSPVHTPPSPVLSALALFPPVLAAVACVVASSFGLPSAFRSQICLIIWTASAASAVLAVSLLLNWASAAAASSTDKAGLFPDLLRFPNVARNTSTDEEEEGAYHLDDYAGYYAYFTDGEEDDDMNGPRRGPSQIGISLHENHRSTQSHGRGRGRGGYSMPPGSHPSGDRAGPDGRDSGSPFLGRRGSGRGRGRGRGRGDHFGGAGFDKPFHPREARGTSGWDAGGWDGRDGRGGRGGRGGRSERGGRGGRGGRGDYRGGYRGGYQGRDDASSRGRGPETPQQRTLPFRPARGVVNVAPAANTVPSKPSTAVSAIPTAALPSNQPGPRENPDQIRRARRAERAVQIFREQCQKLQAEDAARQKGAKNAQSAELNGLLLTSSASCSSEVASSTISGDRVAVANTTSKVVHFHPSPTPQQTAIFASTITSSAGTILQTSSVGGAARTVQVSRTSESVGVENSGAKSADFVVAQVPAMATSMKRKSDAALMSSDGDGNDSDDSSSGFVMTRTAGKRRINLSSGDLLANEILHDINEDLNTVSEDVDECDPVKRLHRGYMNEAIAMAQLALRTNETPVGCVLIHNGRAIAKGMNATNITRNGTRHAELMCLNALFSQWEDVSDDESCMMDDGHSDCDSAQDYDDSTKEFTEKDWEQVDPCKGHLYPYGQKLHPARVVNPDIMRECSLYVTVEPCIMCASMLRQYGIQKVYFGAANDKFGGTGGVLRIHMNSKPNVPPTPNATYIETYVTSMLSKPKRTRTMRQFHDSATAETSSDPDAPPSEAAPVRRASTIPIAEGSVPARDSGHGGNVEPGFAVEGGWGRDKAVFLLRQFYVQENGRAPAPRKKEGRAQRLVEQMKNENSSTVKLPPSAIGHQAELEAELDSLPLEASSPARAMEETLVNAASENAGAE